MISVNRYKCCYCGACTSVCPNNALELSETWLDISKDCTNCYICTNICPVGALEMEK
jgi:ferredoxin